MARRASCHLPIGHLPLVLVLVLLSPCHLSSATEPFRPLVRPRPRLPPNTPNFPPSEPPSPGPEPQSSKSDHALNQAKKTRVQTVPLPHPPPPKGNLPQYITSFEVARPITAPAGSKACVVRLMTNQLFGNNPPPYIATYEPPLKCAKSWSLVKLSWFASIGGVQFDRIGSVSFDGLEVARTITAEPFKNGTKWSFETDITRFVSFLRQKRQVSITIGNVVDKTYTGVFNVSVALTFYPGNTPSRFADVIIPLSAKSTGFAPFGLTNGTNVGRKILSKLPRNAYRAQVEILQSPTANDEFYWSNVPNEYLSKIPVDLRKYFLGGGVFRETQVYLDGLLLGATWQPPIFYTGAINPFWWSPVVGIGAFVIAPSVVDISPCVGNLVDGRNHTVDLTVAGVVTGGTWFVAGALHLWLDKRSKQTSGALLSHKVAPYVKPIVSVKFYSDIDANITTTATRITSLVGYVTTSFGNLTASVNSTQTLRNDNEVLDEGGTTSVNQILVAKASVKLTAGNGAAIYRYSEDHSAPIGFTSTYFTLNRGFVTYGEYHQSVNFERKTTYNNKYVLTESQKNSRNGEGVISNVYKSYGYSSQNLTYTSNFQGCYARSFSQKDYVFDYDKVKTTCKA